MIGNWREIIRKVFPDMSREYLSAVNLDAFELELLDAGILHDKHAFAAFFATIGVESGNLKFTRENLNYSAAQIEKVFGVGRHSAGITTAEVKALARQPERLAERVYGLGNPKKAAELGNTMPGDGFKFRGLGPIQLTGRAAIEDAMDHFGLNSIEELLGPRHLFSAALRFWLNLGLNQIAAAGDLRTVRRRVNGGFNGYVEFEGLFNRIIAHAGGDEPRAASSTRTVQRMLVDLGYDLEIDGSYGPKTRAAVLAFQRQANLKADGIAGPVTVAALELRFAARGAVQPPKVDRVSQKALAGAGGTSAGLGVAGETVMSVARELGAVEIGPTWFRMLPPLLMIAGLSLIVWSAVKARD